jgi:shikimate dehydrogenase
MGWPVMHSRSPALHNYWFAHYQLAGTYVPLAVEPANLAAALRGLQPLGFAGCNLTIPHKETAMAIVDEVDASAKRIGAISCVTVRADGKLVGTNNDAYGFVQNILQQQPAWRPDRGPAVVIGAGGGARAVVYSLADQGVREIRVVNRTLARAESLAGAFASGVVAVGWDERHVALQDAALLVNTTSQGMVGQPALYLNLEGDMTSMRMAAWAKPASRGLPKSALVCDIVYVPLETPLLAAARQRGNPTVDGLGMLLHQARPAWKAWFGIEPAVTPELRARIEATFPR